jgi:hypothetical protein
VLVNHARAERRHRSPRLVPDRDPAKHDRRIAPRSADWDGSWSSAVRWKSLGGSRLNTRLHRQRSVCSRFDGGQELIDRRYCMTEGRIGQFERRLVGLFGELGDGVSQEGNMEALFERMATGALDAGV